MNRTFKVVFNKARGALMVANEVTSSVQKKGAKTVLAAAAMLIAGTAISAETITYNPYPSAAFGYTPDGEVVQASSTQEGFKGSATLQDGVLTIDASGWASSEKGYGAFTNLVRGDDNPSADKGAWGDLTIIGTFDGNTSDEAGGAMSLWHSGSDGSTSPKHTVKGSYTNNQANVQGGAIALMGQNAFVVPGKTTISAYFEKNTAGDKGGAVFSENNNLTVSQSKFTGNSAVNYGGALYLTDTSAVIENSEFTTNVVTADASMGGAIYTDGKLEISNTNFTENSAKKYGGAIAGTVDGKGDVTITGGTFSKNTAGAGGAIALWSDGSSNNAASLTINGTKFEGNSADRKGGAIVFLQNHTGNEKKAEATIESASFTGNEAGESGGALHLEYVGATISNSSFTGNSAGSNGGAIYVAANASLTLKGDNTFSGNTANEVGNDIYNAGSLVIADGVTSAQSGIELGANGSLTISAAGTLVIDGTLTANEGATLTNNGTLKTSYKNFFTAKEGDAGLTATDAVASVTGSGVVDLVDVTGTYTFDQLKDTQDQFNTEQDGDSLQIVFSNGKLELTGTEDWSASKVEGFILSDVVGTTTDGTFSVAKDTTLAGVNFGSATSATVEATGGKLTLVGNDSGDVFAFGEDTQITNVTATNVQLGTDAASKGQVNVETLTVAGTFDVVGNYTANEISVGESAKTSVAGALDVKTLSGEGTMNVADGGVLTAGQIDADVKLTTNGMLVLGDVPVQDEPVVAHLARKDVSGQVNGTVEIGVVGAETGENILTTNLAAGEALKAAIADGQYGEGTESYNGIYVDKTISVGTAGQVVVGTFDYNERRENIAIGKDVVTVIDMNAFSSGDVVFDASSVVFNNEGKAVLTNLYSEKTVKLISGTDEVEGNTAQVFKDSSTNVFLTASAVQNTEEGGTDLVVKVNENVTTDAGLKGALGGLLAEGANLDNQKVLAAIGEKNSGFVNEAGNALTAAGVQATKEYLTAPVTAGTYNVAYDAANVISDKLIQRNLEVKNGLGVWADVFYASNETDTLYGASGYSADIYGGMLGVDMAFGEGARVGAALSIGTGDADSEGSVFKYSSDADFWGLSLYAGKDVGGLTFTADMSYLWLDNDISGSVNGASASESLDSTVFTIGARADWAAYAGDVMQVVPHVGIRWANIDVDDYRGMSMDSMNVIEMPIGVTVKGNFETASGWTVTPAFDFTVAPQIGDTEVETIVGDVDVIDNVYNATIGVSAGNDTMRFGLDYKYGFGNEGRSNNTFNLKASYLF